MKTKIDRVIEELGERTNNGSGDDNRDSDRALYALLSQFKEQLPELDDRFHKSFRQMDCIEDDTEGTTDYVIWLLLCQSTLFWKILDEVENGFDDQL